MNLLSLEKLYGAWGIDTVTDGGSYCDVFINNRPTDFEWAVTRYNTVMTSGANSGYRDGCSKGIVLMPHGESDTRVSTAMSPLVLPVSNGLYFSSKPEYNSWGTAVRQCDSINSSRYWGGVNYERQYCHNASDGRPNRDLVVIDVSHYNGDDSCPIKVQANAKMYFLDVTIKVKPGTDLEKVICKAERNSMGEYVRVDRNVLLAGSRQTPLSGVSTSTSNVHAYIYNINVVYNNDLPGSGGMNGSGSGGSGPDLTCRLVAGKNVDGNGWALRVRTNGSVSNIQTTDGVNVCSDAMSCAGVPVVNPTKPKCYVAHCVQSGQKMNSNTYTSNPICLDQGVVEGTGGNNPGTGGMGTGGMGTGGMSGGSGGNGTGGAGGNLGGLDCRLGVSVLSSGDTYRLSWSRANTESVFLSRDTTNIDLPDGATYLDVPFSELSQQHTYILTLRGAMGVAECAESTRNNMMATLSRPPACSFGDGSSVTRNANGTYTFHYSFTNARSARFTSGPSAPTVTLSGNGSVTGEFTTPVITETTTYAAETVGFNSLLPNSMCALVLDPARSGGETAPTCGIRSIAMSGNAYQVIYNVSDDATITQLQTGATRTAAQEATPQNLDFSGISAVAGIKSMTRSEQVSSRTVYLFTAKKTQTGPACTIDTTLVPNIATPADPDPDHDGICNIVVDPPPSTCHYTPNGVDNCPFISNPDQADTNYDGIGDVCLDPALSPTEPAYAEGSGFSCQMMGASKSAEAIVPFFVLIVGFIFFKIGFGKSYKM